MEPGSLPVPWPGAGSAASFASRSCTPGAPQSPPAWGCEEEQRFSPTARAGPACGEELGTPVPTEIAPSLPAPARAACSVPARALGAAASPGPLPVSG